jgi:hypothetical protein
MPRSSKSSMISRCQIFIALNQISLSVEDSAHPSLTCQSGLLVTSVLIPLSQLLTSICASPQSEAVDQQRQEDRKGPCLYGTYWVMGRSHTVTAEQAAKHSQLESGWGQSKHDGRQRSRRNPRTIGSWQGLQGGFLCAEPRKGQSRPVHMQKDSARLLRGQEQKPQRWRTRAQSQGQRQTDSRRLSAPRGGEDGGSRTCPGLWTEC